jgi:hypothetical protein
MKSECNWIPDNLSDQWSIARSIRRQDVSSCIWRTGRAFFAEATKAGNVPAIYVRKKEEERFLIFEF